MEIIYAKKRIEYYDVLRGIGIIYMILGHVYFGEFFGKYIHAFHMPLFFYISGYFFMASKYKNFGQFIKHILRTLILPYTVFVLICQPLHYIYTKEFNFKYFLLSYFTSNHNRIDVAGAYWFLLCLFTTEVIYYYIDRYIKKDNIKFCVVTIITLLGNFMRVDLPLCLDSAMSMILLMYLGQWVRKNKEKVVVKKIGNLSIYVLILLLIINFFLIMINGSVNIRRNNLSNVPLFWVNCILAILCYVNLAKIVDCSKNKIVYLVHNGLSYIGKNSIVYLTINEIVIYFVTVCMNYAFKIVGYSTESTGNYVGKIIISILTVIIITFVTAVSDNTKLKKIFGASCIL